MEGDSDSAAIRPSSAAEAAPAPGSLGETNALLRELVEAVNGVTAELRRLSPAKSESQGNNKEDEGEYLIDKRTGVSFYRPKSMV